MHSEAVFIACYALLLVGVAGGIHRLGKIDTSPWRSRALAAHRRQVPEPPPTDQDDWPHSEAGRLNTLIALITALSAITLVIVELARHHRPAEIAMLGAVGLTAATTTAVLAHAFAGRPGARTPPDRS
ncbi:hypothetical protein [Spirillospora sp. NPDC048823]|uniref:hypothetical protein n=1 Tax=unclassified Spirillospora TaxID=2642701 RepID=UPI00371011C6